MTKQNQIRGEFIKDEIKRYKYCQMCAKRKKLEDVTKIIVCFECVENKGGEKNDR